jgi:hypothetical protein
MALHVSTTFIPSHCVCSKLGSDSDEDIAGVQSPSRHHDRHQACMKTLSIINESIVRVLNKVHAFHLHEELHSYDNAV